MAIDPAERLLNLIIALTHARVRMTRAQIRESVAGYDPGDDSQTPAEAARKDAAFERMFERDKDDLRRMGIPLQTVVDPTHGDEIGYRIDPSHAAMPPIDLTPAEQAVVALAAEFWSDSTVGSDARQALTKVVSTGSLVPAIELPFAVRSAAATEALAVLAEARSRRQAVTFEYHAASSGVALRTVEVWQFRFRLGAQYVLGLDTNRNAARTFRLSRIVGPVRLVGTEGAYSIPDPLPDEGQTQQSKTAMLAVRPESGHLFRQVGRVVDSRDGFDVIEVDFLHEDELRDQVLMLGGAVRVLEPSELAQSIAEYASAAVEVVRG